MKLSHHFFIVLVLLCQISGLILFLKGFFPIKKGLDGVATLTNLPPEPGKQGRGSPLPAKFDRLVIILVDALRADFVFPSNSKGKDSRIHVPAKMEYVWKLINSSKTVRYCN